MKPPEDEMSADLTSEQRKVLVTPWLREVVDLPPAADDALALCAAGLVLDSLLPAEVPIPREVDLETLAYADPALVVELRRRLRSGIDRALVPESA
ncbi:hypothetical protein [Amycolatopsis thailandensis]|uniref:hypothetical protein n=1 Tax=Amycolatopsis thailandensis TaxID=589330 RepID=UPI00117800C5|nr:hypothetical protein [Amycolatopsis thailandensis]